MWEMDHKEGWVPKNWCFWTVVLEKTLESPLDCKEIKLVNPKGNQSWIFIGRTDAKAEAPTLWPPDAKIDSLAKILMVEKIEVGGKGDNRGWDGWMTSPTQWTWVWASSRRWWRTRKPGMLQSKGSQRVGHDWATEQQQYPSTITSLHYKDQLNTEASYKLWNHHPPSTISKCNKNSLLFDC